MKKFNNSMVRVKNQNGEYVSLDAIRGESIYDLAVRYGYVGTEEDLIKEIMTDGWVTFCEKLATEKADRDEVYTKEETYSKSEVDNRHKIGDIYQTVRTDLGDNWLLCNGSAIDSRVYSKLCENSIVPYKRIDYAAYDLDYYGGIWITTNTLNGIPSSSTSKPLIFVISDITGNLLQVTLPCTTGACTKAIVCGDDGTWVVSGTYYNEYPVIWTTKDPNGTWVEKQIEAVENYTGEQTLAYGNGVYVLVCNGTSSESYGVKIYASRSPSDGWTNVFTQKNTNPTGIKHSITGIAYHDGKWCAVGTSESGINIYTATDPFGAWTLNEISGIGDSGGIYDVTAYNGSWVISGYGSTGYTRISTTNDPTGVWTTYTATGKNPKDIACYNGEWVIAIQGGILTSTDPINSDSWNTFYPKDHGHDTSSEDFYGVVYKDGIWSIGGRNSFISSARRATPTIELNGAYAYIKASEVE